MADFDYQDASWDNQRAVMKRMSLYDAAALLRANRDSAPAHVGQKCSDSLVGLGLLVPRNKSVSYNEVSPLGKVVVRQLLEAW